MIEAEEEDKTLEAKALSPTKCMALLLMKGTDQYIYGALQKIFLYQFSLGNEKYPKTITTEKQTYCKIIDLNLNSMKIIETSIPVTEHAMILNIKRASQLYFPKNIQHAIFVGGGGIYHHIVPR